jgi:HTH-type transcriptional regulator/antitoxin HigA
MATALADPAQMIEMIERGAPHLIHNDEQLERYTSMLFRFSEIENPSELELEAIELLGTLIEKYESERHPIPPAPPRDVLRFLIDQNGLHQRDLVPEFGSEAQVSMFLNGHRQLSVDQIRRLSERFHVSPAAFMQMA